MSEREYTHNELYEVSVEELKPNPHQPRKAFDEDTLKELSDSISEKGLLQPIIFTELEGQKIVLAGERRLRASKDAGIPKIRGIFHEITTTDPDAITKIQLEIGIIENLHRQDLTPMEEAEAMAALESLGRTHKDIGKATGYSRSRVTELIKLTKLPEEIKNSCKTGAKCSRANLFVLLGLDNPESQKKLFNELCDGTIKSEYIKRLNGNDVIVKRNYTHVKALINTSKILLSQLNKFDTALNEGNDTKEEGEEVALVEQIDKLTAALDSLKSRYNNKSKVAFPNNQKYTSSRSIGNIKPENPTEL